MKNNIHGFKLRQEITIGGIDWTIFQTGEEWVKCITSDCVEELRFDNWGHNNFATSSLRYYLNSGFLCSLIKAGAPKDMFVPFLIDLTSEDGLKNYGKVRVMIGLITCAEYRLLRNNMPKLPWRHWWTATPSSPCNCSVRKVNIDGALHDRDALSGYIGVRPVCKLKTEILKQYLNGKNK